MSDLEALVGMRAQRIDGPRADLIAITLHGRELHGVLLLETPRAGDARWGWVEERPRGAPASSFVSRLRKHLENARLAAITVDDHGASVMFVRGEQRATLRLTIRPAKLELTIDPIDRGRAGRAVSARETDSRGGSRCGETIDDLQAEGSPAPRTPASERGRTGARVASSFDALRAAGPAIVREAVEGAQEEERRELRRLATRRRRQLARRLAAIEGDRARPEEIARLRAQGSLLLAHLHAIPDGAREAEVTDWNADPPAPLRIPIGPRRSAREEAEALFRRAQKLERGTAIAASRHAETATMIDRLDALARAIDQDGALEPIRASLAALGARGQPRSAAEAARTRLPYRAIRASGDRLVLVGRSAADNDALTLRHARPWDLWLHARGVSGSHVVVPLEKGETCPPELLVDAAHLAAHFSDAKGEDRVEVQHLERRHVRKPRGAAPGAVTLRGERVLMLRVEPARLRALLDRGEG